MSSPTSTKLAPPTYLDPRIRRRFLIPYIMQIWISLVPTSFLLYWFYYDYISDFPLFSTGILTFSFQKWVESFWLMPNYIMFLISPLILILLYIITVFWSAIITKLSLFILNMIHHPIEGVFIRDLNDKDYFFWNLRNLTRVFLFWMLHSIPFTFLKITFSYRFFGVHVGKNSTINHCWISPEFIEIGDDVVIGQSAAIYSFQFQGDKLLVGKVKIEDNVHIGPQVIIFPGSTLHKNVVIDGGAFAHPFTEFEENGIYHGAPVKLIRKKFD